MVAIYCIFIFSVITKAARTHVEPGTLGIRDIVVLRCQQNSLNTDQLNIHTARLHLLNVKNIYALNV